MLSQLNRIPPRTHTSPQINNKYRMAIDSIDYINNTCTHLFAFWLVTDLFWWSNHGSYQRFAFSSDAAPHVRHFVRPNVLPNRFFQPAFSSCFGVSLLLSHRHFSQKMWHQSMVAIAPFRSYSIRRDPTTSAWWCARVAAMKRILWICWCPAERSGCRTIQR